MGGKEYRFTWSHEMGGLCDIYEERQSCEDGNGLLVESGCSWRKLNVQRVLDESTKKQVKKRSEEYEQKLKSRKYVIQVTHICIFTFICIYACICIYYLFLFIL